MPRIRYNREFSVPLHADQHGPLLRLAVRFSIEGGVRRRWCVGLQCRNDADGGRFVDICRWDDWHGPLHRHRPAVPPGPPETVLAVPPGVDPIAVATADADERAYSFFEEAVRNGFPVWEDETGLG